MTKWKYYYAHYKLADGMTAKQNSQLNCSTTLFHNELSVIGYLLTDDDFTALALASAS